MRSIVLSLAAVLMMAAVSSAQCIKQADGSLSCQVRPLVRHLVPPTIGAPLPPEGPRTFEEAAMVPPYTLPDPPSVQASWVDSETGESFPIVPTAADWKFLKDNPIPNDSLVQPIGLTVEVRPAVSVDVRPGGVTVDIRRRPVVRRWFRPRLRIRIERKIR